MCAVTKRSSLSAAVATVLLVPPALALVLGWFCKIKSQATFDYGPAQMAAHVRLFLQGDPLYPDCRTFPCMPLAYGPVVPWLAALVTPIFGARSIAPLEAGRLLVVSASIAASVLIFWLGRRAGASAGAAGICALGFLLSPFLDTFGFEFRVDMPSLAFDLGGIALFGAGLEYPAIGSFVLCWLAKQARIAGIAAVLLYLWLNGDRRRAVTLGAAYAGALILAGTLLQFFYPYFWMNTFGALMVMDDLLAGLRWFCVLTKYALPILALAAIGIFTKAPRRNLAVCFLLAAIGQDFVSSLHFGSNVNYFIPTLAASSVVAAPELDYLLQRGAGFPKAWRIAFGVAIAWAIMGPLLGRGSFDEPGLGSGLDSFRVAANCRSADSSSWDAITAQLSTIRGIVLTDVPTVALIDQSKDIWFLDLMPLDVMRRRGVLDDRPLIAALNARRIAAVALDTGLLNEQYRGRDLFWPELREAIVRNYALAPRSGPLLLALPREEPR